MSPVEELEDKQDSRTSQDRAGEPERSGFRRLSDVAYVVTTNQTWYQDGTTQTDPEEAADQRAGGTSHRRDYDENSSFRERKSIDSLLTPPTTLASPDTHSFDAGNGSGHIDVGKPLAKETKSRSPTADDRTHLPSSIDQNDFVQQDFTAEHPIQPPRSTWPVDALTQTDAKGEVLEGYEVIRTLLSRTPDQHLELLTKRSSLAQKARELANLSDEFNLEAHLLLADAARLRFLPAFADSVSKLDDVLKSINKVSGKFEGLLEEVMDAEWEIQEIEEDIEANLSRSPQVRVVRDEFDIPTVMPIGTQSSPMTPSSEASLLNPLPEVDIDAILNDVQPWKADTKDILPITQASKPNLDAAISLPDLPELRLYEPTNSLNLRAQAEQNSKLKSFSEEKSPLELVGEGTHLDDQAKNASLIFAAHMALYFMPDAPESSFENHELDGFSSWLTYQHPWNGMGWDRHRFQSETLRFLAAWDVRRNTQLFTLSPALSMGNFHVDTRFSKDTRETRTQTWLWEPNMQLNSRRDRTVNMTVDPAPPPTDFAGSMDTVKGTVAGSAPSDLRRDFSTVFGYDPPESKSKHRHTVSVELSQDSVDPGESLTDRARSNIVAEPLRTTPKAGHHNTSQIQHELLKPRTRAKSLC